MTIVQLYNFSTLFRTALLSNGMNNAAEGSVVQCTSEVMIYATCFYLKGSKQVMIILV